MRTLPSWWQVVVAVIIGVCIGLVASKYIYVHRPESINVALDQASTAINNVVAKANPVPQLEQRMNILLMGVDSNGANTQRFVSTRSDTMMLVSCDPVNKRVGVVSIPRDSRVTIPGHGNDKINAAHAFGGPELAVETVKQDFLVPVDHYMVIDVQGLKKVFQVLGPIEVKVEKKMRYVDHAGHLRVALDPGVQYLTPEQAEEYVRFRHDARGDIGRIDRQQWFMRQVTNKLREPAVILKLPELFKLANEYVVTDLSIEDMARLASFGKDIKPNQVETAVLPGDAQTIRGGSYWIPNADASEAIFNRLLGTPMNGETASIGSPNSAIAAEPESTEKPLSFIIRYPKGAEKTALAFEKEFQSSGYTVKYRTRGDASDCAHEQLIQNSYRTNDAVTQRLRDHIQNIGSWPVVVALDNRASADFTVVISADTPAPPIPTELDKEATTEQNGKSPTAQPVQPAVR